MSLIRRRVHFVTEAIGFVLRYRALWDKIMGLLVVLLVPDRYEAFVKADSLKREFLKVVGPTLALDVVENSIAMVQEFDDDFRTAEAHGSGRLRKLIYTDTIDPEELHEQFLAYMLLAELWVAALADALAPDREKPLNPPAYLEDHADLVQALRAAVSRTLRPPLNPVR